MAVFLAKAGEYQSSSLSSIIAKGINELGLDLKGKKSALLKPNIVNVAKPDSAKITHPTFVEAIIDVLREMGIDDITVGDGPAVDADVSRVFDVSGYSQLARRKKVKLVNFNDVESEEIQMPSLIPYPSLQACGEGRRGEVYEVRVPKLVKEVDLYVNIPKLKTHVNAGVSISLKNQIGLLSRDDKIQFHLMGLHEPIAQLSQVIRPELVIVDGITGSEGEAPIHGRKKKAGVLAIGTDMLEVDLVCCQIMCIEPSTVKAVHEVTAERSEAVHEVTAERSEHIRLLLPEDGTVPQIKTVGEKVEDLKTAFLQPNHRYGKVLNIYSWRNPRSCPLCSVAFNRAIEVAKRNPRYWFSFFPKLMYQAIFKRIDLIKGPTPEMPYVSSTPLPIASKTKEDKSSILCFGDCAQKAAEAEGLQFVRGCPPSPKDMLEGLKQLWR